MWSNKSNDKQEKTTPKEKTKSVIKQKVDFDGYQSTGIKTQFDDVNEEHQHKQLVIGLDFGTAYTKVVVGEERVRYAIPFFSEEGSEPNYLLPSTFWVNDDGSCSLENKTGKQIADLKMRLIKGDFSNKAQINICAYLSMVIRHIRAYILTRKQNIYGSNYIDWLINIGLPTDSFHNAKLSETYQKIVRAAWNISTLDKNITLDTVRTALDVNLDDDFQKGESIHQELITPFPEFVAQITGYVRSPLRQSDMHLFIDVGAGTLDVTIFNVHEDDGEDVYPIFAKAVELLGTRFLVKNRLEQTEIQETGELDSFHNVPNKKRFAELLSIDNKQLFELDRPLRAKVNKVLTDLLTYTKNKRYPNSPKWQSGIPLFLCGGGSKCDFYQELLLKNNKISNYLIRENKLPKPENLEAPGLDSINYDRLLVAYGLSYDPFDIGEITKENDIKNIERENKSSQKYTKKGICQRCNGTGGLHSICTVCNGSGWIK